ncbi:MAG TPA: MBL fold metallo-hydrolase [Clostridiales bacterium]|nr:MBL fold metallo-hydrolase [Clostridiales bacterium]
MKITDNIYQISGLAFGTNSNAYVIDAGEELILIDAGFSDYQWEVMQKSIKFWGLEKKPITHTFITHCHFDHAGNTWLAKEAGSRIYAGDSDAQGIETGDIRTIGHMFGREFKPCKVDHILKDGEVFQIGNKEIRALYMPGHSVGSYMFQVDDNGRNCLFLGDFVALNPDGAEDDVIVLLSWTGGPDYDRESYVNSLKRAVGFEPVIMLPGHWACFYGDSQTIFKRAYQLGLELKDEG